MRLYKYIGMVIVDRFHEFLQVEIDSTPTTAAAAAAASAAAAAATTNALLPFRNETIPGVRRVSYKGKIHTNLNMNTQPLSRCPENA